MAFDEADKAVLEIVERLVVSFESIADSLKRWVDAEYPAKPKVVRDADVSRIPTDDDRAREAQGAAPEEPISEWIGLREREFDDPAAKEKA